MATPPKAELKDYVWCVGCTAYVPKKLLVTTAGFMFSTGTTSCPAGHSELQDVSEEAPHDPPKPS